MVTLQICRTLSYDLHLRIAYNARRERQDRSTESTWMLCVLSAKSIEAPLATLLTTVSCGCYSVRITPHHDNLSEARSLRRRSKAELQSMVLGDQRCRAEAW
jgi:hypothetical protein